MSRASMYEGNEWVGTVFERSFASLREASEKVGSLTHEWTAVHIESDDLRTPWGPGHYVMGGQPDEDGRPAYVLHLQESDGDIAVAAEQIAAALRGEG